MDKPQLARKEPKNVISKQSHPYLYEQLCKLSLSLGKPKHNVKESMKYLLASHPFDNDDRHELVVLDNLRLRFENLQKFGNSRNQDLNEVRANLCMHLYRELVRVEPNDDKRYQYLKLCYELFDAGEPVNMTEEETLSYRLKMIDSLNNQVNNLIRRLRTVEDDQDTSMGSVSLFQDHRQIQNELKFEVYAKTELTFHRYCALKGIACQYETQMCSKSTKSTTKSFNESINHDLQILINQITESKLYSGAKLVKKRQTEFLESKKQFDIKVPTLNSKKNGKTVNENFLKKTSHKLNILNDFESRFPRFRQSNSSLGETFSTDASQLNPIQSEITTEGHCKIEINLLKYSELKGEIHHQGLLFCDELGNDSKALNLINKSKTCLPNLQSSKLLDEKLLSKELKSKFNSNDNDLQVEYYAVFEHTSLKFCQMKGLLGDFESSVWAEVKLKTKQNRLSDSVKRNEHLLNDYKKLKHILSGNINGFYKKLKDESSEAMESTLAQFKRDDQQTSNSNYTKRQVENPNPSLKDKSESQCLIKLRSADLKKKLENYKGLLKKLADVRANLGKSIPTSLSKVQLNAEKNSNSANSAAGTRLSLDKTSRSDNAEALDSENLSRSSSPDLSKDYPNIRNKSLYHLRRQARKVFDKYDVREGHSNINKSSLIHESTPFFYKVNIVKYLKHSSCQLKGCMWNFGSVVWIDEEQTNHFHIMAQFRKMDDVLANVQKALNQIIESHDCKLKSCRTPRSANLFSTQGSLRTSPATNRILDKNLQDNKFLIDEMEDLRFNSIEIVNNIFTNDKVKAKSNNQLDNSLTDSFSGFSTPTSPNFSESSSSSDDSSVITVKSLNHTSNETMKTIDEENKCAASSQEFKSPNGWQHQRHTVAAPAVILHLFKSNPAYQRSPIDSNGPDFFEELEQFKEIMGNRANPLTRLIDVTAVYDRIKLTLDRLKNQVNHRDWRDLVGKIQLKNLLTQQERGAFEVMRWQLIDRSDVELSDVERLRDAFNGMLGCECRQLRYSFISKQMLLRSPDRQRSLSESYLLLILGQLGYSYQILQNQQEKLSMLGKSGFTLAQSQRFELLQYKEFHLRQQQSEKLPSLFCIWKMSTNSQTTFQWMIDLNCRIIEEQNVLSILLEELYQGCNEKLLRKWLLLISQPMIERLSRWLYRGELNDYECAEFFIMNNVAVPTDKFWQRRFILLTENIPVYLNKQLCQSIMTVGKYHRYGKEFLGIDTQISLNYGTFIKAFQSTYQHRELVSFHNLAVSVQQEVSSYILNYHEPPIDFFYKLFKYVLLRDIHFVTKLIDYLEPVLEQSACSFDLIQFNYMLEEILTEDNCKLYIREVPSEGAQCWSRFQLSWHWSYNWRALLGKGIESYSLIFTDLWKFHYSYYVLCERILRQQKHFGVRIKLDHFDDVNQVEKSFQTLIKFFLCVMNTLRDYLFSNVLDEAYAQLKIKCNEVKTLDDIIKAHNQYLNAIKVGFFQTTEGHGCIFYLTQLFKFVFNLDVEQQKFLSLCQLLMDFQQSCPNRETLSKRLVDFHSSCRESWNSLNHLEDNFQLSLNSLMKNLNDHEGKKANLLAKKLKANLYKNDERTLEQD